MPLSKERVADYERAAVALETHSATLEDDHLAGKAWCKACKAAPEMSSYDAIDIEAARLLRESVNRGEEIS
jgi:hypothetical protein